MIYLRLLGIGIWLCIGSFTAFVVAILRWGDTNLNHDLARVVGIPILRIAGMRLEILNGERLEDHRPCVFVMNHQSNFDAFVLGSIFPRHTVIIGKKEILYVPFFGLAYAAAGNFLIDRKNRTSAIADLARAVRRMRERRVSIVIFPEGTRNRTDAPLQSFKKGAFHMALEAGVPVVPIVVSPIRELFDWSEKRLTPGTVRIRVLEPVSTRGMRPDQVAELSDQVRERMMEAIRGR